jgi:uncharacterized integral membrane protein
MARDVERRPEGEGRGIDPKLIAGGILLVLLLVFVFQNTETTTVDFLMFDIEAPLWVMLGITAVVGMLIGYLAGRRRYRT